MLGSNGISSSGLPMGVPPARTHAVRRLWSRLFEASSRLSSSGQAVAAMLGGGLRLQIVHSLEFKAATLSVLAGLNDKATMDGLVQQPGAGALVTARASSSHE